MAKTSKRARSRYTDEALQLLGRMIHVARIEHKWTAEELAARAGITRSLLKRIEDGHPGCEVGTVFETAAVVGIKLFDADRSRLADMSGQVESKIALLPKAVRKSLKVHDEF